MIALETQIDGRQAGVADLTSVGVVIPTFNASRHWTSLRRALEAQGLAPEQVLVVDSTSTDGTCLLALKAGYRVITIEQSEFSHGGTRQMANEHLSWADLVIYLTQDAVPAEASSFQRLCEAFDDPDVGAAYGRQLARRDAGPIERHARLFNYPAVSSTRSYASRSELGIKAAFLSNSFAAYRRTALDAVGGFPTDVIMAEDSVVAARLLLADWKVSYVAEAAVIHSHPLTLRQEFSRYFDTGVHHARESWILERFGRTNEEGKRFILSELSYLLATRAHLIPVAAVRTLSKFVAYQMGLRERRLGLGVKSYLSAQPGFWSDGKQAMSERSHPAGNDRWIDTGLVDPNARTPRAR